MKKQKRQEIIMECKWYQVCPMKMFYEKGKIEEKWINNYCKGNWETCIRFKKEKNEEYHPDWMLPDGSMDEKLKNI